MHPVLRKFLLVVLGYAVFVIGAEIGGRVKEARIANQFQAQLDAIVAEHNKILEAERNDFYGGKTPDETLAMFIDALKKGDFDLAEKYIASNDAKYKFKTMRENGEMADFVGSLGNIRKRDMGYYSILDNEGWVISTVSLNKNLNGTWKITDL